MKNAAAHMAELAALRWYVDQGIDEPLLDQPVNYFKRDDNVARVIKVPEEPAFMRQDTHISARLTSKMPPAAVAQATFLGASDAYEEAIRLAASANTLEELRQALAGFDGIAVKKTATNLVFSDGNPKAHVMLVGEAPGADEDRQGKPFVGVSGQLLDKIMKCINLDRAADDPAMSLYISNILNWRPPGNRTPSPAEIEVSLPFIERHIQLVSPKVLILCGGVAAQALLGRTEGVSRLRNKFHDYKTLTPGLQGHAVSIPAIATYHPSYLLRTPSQKKAVWADMLMVAEKIAKFT